MPGWASGKSKYTPRRTDKHLSVEPWHVPMAVRRADAKPPFTYCAKDTRITQLLIVLRAASASWLLAMFGERLVSFATLANTDGTNRSAFSLRSFPA
jgi:hypothetical protein